MTVAPDLDVEFLAQRVHAAHTHAMQSAGDFVGGRVEFAAGMKLGEHYLHRGHHLSVANGHHVHGNPAAVIDHGDGVVNVDHDVNFFGVAGQSLVHGVVYHFVNKVVQPHLAGGADVHGRAQTHSLEALEDFDVFAGIATVVAVLLGKCLFDRYLNRHRVPFAEFSLWAPCGSQFPGSVSGLGLRGLTA